jgi:23S rRNA (pseudouridine1915-N3)-methyltransferase
MQILLIAIGQRMPKWVDAGFEDYAKRLPPESRLKLVAIPALKRSKHADVNRIARQEGERMLAAIPPAARVIALDVAGKALSTEQWAQRLDAWKQHGRDVAFLVGGPEGLDDACLARADEQWSLSSLTLPHPLVRIVFVEQLYRASTILQGHPYHK